MRTQTELRNQIKEFVSTKPNNDISTYKHVTKIGTKFVKILDLYSGEAERISLIGFEAVYMN